MYCIGAFRDQTSRDQRPFGTGYYISFIFILYFWKRKTFQQPLFRVCLQWELESENSLPEIKHSTTMYVHDQSCPSLFIVYITIIISIFCMTHYTFWKGFELNKGCYLTWLVIFQSTCTMQHDCQYRRNGSSQKRGKNLFSRGNWN